MMYAINFRAGMTLFIFAGRMVRFFSRGHDIAYFRGGMVRFFARADFSFRGENKSSYNSAHG